ncbi:MAG TPA: hypothetical protein VGK01_11910 [Candidatus Angelobacter sp.]|jgi:hypothetical protein
MEIETHSAGYGPFVDDKHLELVGIQHRRNAAGIFVTLYAQKLRDASKAKLVRRLKQASKAIRTGKRVRHIKFLTS